jgi:putative sterol carrier protein
MAERPPADITPNDFFTTWIPGQFSAVREKAGDTAIPDVTARFVLEGDDGGTWTLSIRGGELSATSGGDGDADVVITQSVQNWRAVLAQDVSMPGGGGGGAGGLLANPTAIQTIRDLSGTLKFEVTETPEGTWAIEIAFKGAETPNAAITVAHSTVEEMRSGALPPAQAFFGGKLAITGDSAFAMQVGMALMAGMA